MFGWLDSSLFYRVNTVRGTKEMAYFAGSVG